MGGGKKKTITAAPDMDQKFEISRGSATVPERRRKLEDGSKREEEDDDDAGGDINNKRIFLLFAAKQSRATTSLLVLLIPIPAVQKTAAAVDGYIVCFSGFSSYPMRRREKKPHRHKKKKSPKLSG